MIRVFALTGGIASGKSTVAARWLSHDVPVIDADAIAHKILAGKLVAAELTKEFGQTILDGSGLIDRKVLGKIVFADPDAKTLVESIVHPRVADVVELTTVTLENLGHTLACYDVPLLFEKGLDSKYSPVVVVNIDPSLQLLRLMQRNPHLSEIEALSRIGAQMPLVQKVSRADYVIDNSGSLDELYKQCDIVIEVIKGYR